MTIVFQADIQIAVGNNNAAGLVALESITPSGDIAFLPVRQYGTFNAGETKTRLNGRPYFAGVQSTQFICAVVTWAQFKYLKTTYCNGGYSGLVTIRIRTDSPATYANYNAVLVLPKESDLAVRYGAFIDVVLNFINLEVLP